MEFYEHLVPNLHTLHNQFSADLFTFTKKILNGKLHYLCSYINQNLENKMQKNFSFKSV